MRNKYLIEDEGMLNYNGSGCLTIVLTRGINNKLQNYDNKCYKLCNNENCTNNH